MPRNYKRNPKSKLYSAPNPENMAKAIDAVNRKLLSVRKAAAKSDVNYSAVCRCLKRGNASAKSHGGQPALNFNEESFIVNRIKICGDWGYPLDAFTLRLLVKQYLDMIGKKVKKFKNNTPGRDWAYSFLHRHKKEISERFCQNIKRSRAAVSKEVLTEYFELLEKELKDVPPENIVNYDETNLRDDLGKKKVIVRPTSIMFSAAGDCTILPPYVVYKSVHLYDSWTTEGPKYARYNRTKSGWFDAVCFEDWVRTIAIPYLKKLNGKKILIGDNLASHVSIEIIRLCLEHEIYFIYLPPNSTHLTQPLDVAVSAPTKKHWRQILEDWKLKSGKNSSCVPKDKFPRLLNSLMKKIHVNGANNVKSGFRKCGTIPLNKNEVLKMLPEELDASESQSTREIESLDQAFVSLLKSMRYEDTNKPKKKTKLKVTAGKSFSVENFGSSESGSESDTSSDQCDVEMSEPLENGNTGSGPPVVKIEVVDTSVKSDDLNVGDWLIVVFYFATTSKSVKQSSKKFIGKIVSIDKNGTFEATFVRSQSSTEFSGCVYKYPDVEDISTFSSNQIIGRIRAPEKYKRGLLKFEVNSSTVNL